MAVIHGANLQVDVHAVGDRGVDLTLDAFRTAAGSDREVARCRHRIEHFMFRRESRIRRAADLAVWNTDLRTVRTTAEVDRLQVVAMYVSGQPTWTVPPVPAPVDPSQWVKSHARFWLQVTLSNELAADAVCGFGLTAFSCVWLPGRRGAGCSAPAGLASVQRKLKTGHTRDPPTLASGSARDQNSYHSVTMGGAKRVPSTSA